MQNGKSLEKRRIVILGGSSGIGLAVAKEAASQGANVVIVSSKAERVQEAIRSVGEMYVGRRLTCRMKRLWKAFLRTLASLITSFSLQVTACNCTSLLVTMGADGEPLSVSLMDLVSKRIRIIGSQQNGPKYLYEALDFVAQGKVKTIVEMYPLAEAPRAYDRVAEGKARFRAVLTM